MDKKYLLKLSYKYLSFRQRSESEIIKYLHKKTTDQKLISEVLIDLKKQDFINDDDFIDEYIKSYINKGYGPRKIHFNLLNKGIEKTKASQKLGSISNKEWLEGAKKVVIKKQKQLDKLSKPKLKQKIYNLLNLRGHNYQTIKSIIDAYPHLE